MAEPQHPVALLSLYYAGELSLADQKAVSGHVEQCASCWQELALLLQTVELVEELPVEQAPLDFLEKLNQRIDQDPELCRLETQRQQIRKERDLGNVAVETQAFSPSTQLPSSEKSRLGQRFSRFLYSIFQPVPLRIPLYATAAVLILAVFLLRSSFQESLTALTLSSSGQGQVEANKQTARSTEAEPAEETPLMPSLPLASLEGALVLVEPLVWQIAGLQPDAMQEQTKALTRQMPEAVVVQEGEGLLVLSLPTQKIAPFQRGLQKIGRIDTMDSKADPTKPTTVVRLEFVFSPGSSPLLP